MKIGITTFSWAHNYGAMLQAFALQSFLEQRGNDVSIVDFRVKREKSGLTKWVARTPQGCWAKWKTARKEQMFEQFRRIYLNRTTEVYRHADDLKAAANRFDLLITGSDQVWNPLWLDQHPGLSDLFLLSFAGPNVKRIAYAASFGHADTSTIPRDWHGVFQSQLRAMDAISVREASGIDIVADLSGRKDAIHTLDPTLLHCREFYDKLTGHVPRKRLTLFYFMLHGRTSDGLEFCRYLAASRELKIVQYARDNKTPISNARQTHPSPPNWLRTIRDSTFVVTNSFHAAVFCIIFHTPFIVILIDGITGTMNTRIVELLVPLGLGSRILTPGDASTTDVANVEIDWELVDRNLSALRAASVNFIDNQVF